MDLENKTIFKTHQPLAITIAPCNNKQYIEPKNIDQSNRYQSFRAYWHKKLEKLSLHNIYINATIEISEPLNCKKDSIGPRLHLHGTIEFTTRQAIQKFLLYEYHNLLKLNIIDIDTIEDPLKWHQYCTKQHILPKDRHLIMSQPKAIPGGAQLNRGSIADADCEAGVGKPRP